MTLKTTLAAAAAATLAMTAGLAALPVAAHQHEVLLDAQREVALRMDELGRRHVERRRGQQEAEHADREPATAGGRDRGDDGARVHPPRTGNRP